MHDCKETNGSLFSVWTNSKLKPPDAYISSKTALYLLYIINKMEYLYYSTRLKIIRAKGLISY